MAARYAYMTSLPLSVSLSLSLMVSCERGRRAYFDRQMVGTCGRTDRQREARLSEGRNKGRKWSGLVSGEGKAEKNSGCMITWKPFVSIPI